MVSSAFVKATTGNEVDASKTTEVPKDKKKPGRPATKRASGSSTSKKGKGEGEQARSQKRQIEEKEKEKETAASKKPRSSSPKPQQTKNNKNDNNDNNNNADNNNNIDIAEVKNTKTKNAKKITTKAELQAAYDLQSTQLQELQKRVEIMQRKLVETEKEREELQKRVEIVQKKVVKTEKERDDAKAEASRNRKALKEEKVMNAKEIRELFDANRSLENELADTQQKVIIEREKERENGLAQLRELQSAISVQQDESDAIVQSLNLALSEKEKQMKDLMKRLQIASSLFNSKSNELTTVLSLVEGYEDHSLEDKTENREHEKIYNGDLFNMSRKTKNGKRKNMEGPSEEQESQQKKLRVEDVKDDVANVDLVDKSAVSMKLQKDRKVITPTNRVMCERFRSLQVREIKMKDDGNCFFRCISRFVFGDCIFYHGIRSLIVDWMEKNPNYTTHGVTLSNMPDQKWEEYIKGMREDKTWASMPCIHAACELFSAEVVVVSEFTKDGECVMTYKPVSKVVTRRITLSYANKHYNCLVKDDSIQSYEHNIGKWYCSTCDSDHMAWETHCPNTCTPPLIFMWCCDKCGREMMEGDNKCSECEVEQPPAVFGAKEGLLEAIAQKNDSTTTPSLSNEITQSLNQSSNTGLSYDVVDALLSPLCAPFADGNDEQLFQQVNTSALNDVLRREVFGEFSATPNNDDVISNLKEERREEEKGQGNAKEKGRVEEDVEPFWFCPQCLTPNKIQHEHCYECHYAVY